jgi:hypothetical protein
MAASGGKNMNANTSANNNYSNNNNNGASLDSNKGMQASGRGTQADYCSQGKSATTLQKGVYATGGLEFYGCK